MPLGWGLVVVFGTLETGAKSMKRGEVSKRDLLILAFVVVLAIINILTSLSYKK
jgi:hypothetical protein